MAMSDGDSCGSNFRLTKVMKINATGTRELRSTQTTRVFTILIRTTAFQDNLAVLSGCILWLNCISVSTNMIINYGNS